MRVSVYRYVSVIACASSVYEEIIGNICGEIFFWGLNCGEFFDVWILSPDDM